MEGIERLLDRARQGNSEALSVLYHRFLPGIFGYIATRMPDRATAEELTSDVFLQVVVHMRLIARSWLYRWRKGFRQASCMKRDAREGQRFANKTSQALSECKASFPFRVS